MTGWNPNYPCAQGLEWGGSRQVDRPVNGVGAGGVAWLVDSTQKDDVSALWTFSQGRVDNALDRIDIYDTRDLRPVPRVENVSEPGVATITVDATGRILQGARWATNQMENVKSNALPFGLTNMADLLGRFDNLTPAVYEGKKAGDPVGLTWLSEGIEGAVEVPHQSFIGFVPTNPISFLTTNATNKWPWGADALNTGFPFKVSGLDTGITAGTDRVLGLSTSVLAQKLVRNDQFATFANWPVALQPFIIPNPAWGGRSGRGPSFGTRWAVSTSPETYTQVWPLNPFTGKEWTPGQLADLGNTNNPARIGWRIRSLQRGVRRRLLLGSPGAKPRQYGAIESIAGAIYAADFRTVAVEDTRVAFAVRTSRTGTTNVRRQLSGWNRWQVTPRSGQVWAKQPGRQYLFHQTVDEASYGGGAVARGLNQRMISTEAGGGRVPLRETIPQYVDNVPVAAGSPRPWAPAVVLDTEAVLGS